MNGLTGFPLSYLVSKESTVKGVSLGQSAENDTVELDSGSTFGNYVGGVA